MTLNLDDFQKQDIKFDIAKLQQSYKEIIKTKKFDDGGGITNFGAISLTQIPGDPESIKGSNARGVYWTKPGQSGKEVSRDIDINEDAYSEFIKDYENTYFKEVYDKLSSKYKLGKIIDRAISLKIPMVALFPYSHSKVKNKLGSEALNEDNLVCRAIKYIKKKYKNQIGIMCDVALDPYTSHGHDGLLKFQPFHH